MDPDTHAVKIRTSIPNQGNQLKSDMLVRGMLEIPRLPGRTVIPRTALIVDDGRYCVFVKRPGPEEKYEHRRVTVAQEKDDHVVIDRGLKAGESVVSVGALDSRPDLRGFARPRVGLPAPRGTPARTESRSIFVSMCRFPTGWLRADAGAQPPRCIRLL